MNAGELADAQRRALNMFDRWNDVTGVFQRGTGYYFEAQATKDAVVAAIQADDSIDNSAIAPIAAAIDASFADLQTANTQLAAALTANQPPVPVPPAV